MALALLSTTSSAMYSPLRLYLVQNTGTLFIQ
jgi:hypothetical protein